ncbi:zinc ribbon domain-containing protein [Streptomyces populi]|uniref:zinc ribbon domain-containing protein n=1 Tax=Streptomyces populi TaxID=2058924 RepID=UPI0035D8985B
MSPPPTPVCDAAPVDGSTRTRARAKPEFVCSSCGFTCNADTNAATNVAAGQGGFPRPRRSAGAGGTTPPKRRSSVREPQPSRVGISLF